MSATKKKIVRKKPMPKAEEQPVQEKIEVTAKAEDLCGVYCNFAVFKHTRREFVTDFVWRLDNTNMLVSRVITSPQHAKAIYRALGSNIENYEKQFGEIDDNM